MSPYAQRDSSVSPPAHAMYARSEPLSPPSVPHQYLNQNNNIIKSEHFSARSQHRYMPYSLGHHHPLMMPVDQSSLSPTSSQASYNSYLSSRRSLSPASSHPSSADDSAISVLTEKSNSSSNIQKVKSDGELSEKQTGAPRYQCPDCGKSYSTYSGLSKHQQFHCPAAEGNQAQKTFVCKECDKPYKTLGALKMHIRTHTLPCKCHLCDKAFSRPWLLQGHIRTHTGEKPFVCKLCSRAFADRSNLRAHQQTHEDVKRFKCQSCTKSFSRLPLLNKHAETGCPGVPLPGNNNNNTIKHEEDNYMPSVLPNNNIAVY
jgi:snail-like protein